MSNMQRPLVNGAASSPLAYTLHFINPGNPRPSFIAGLHNSNLPLLGIYEWIDSCYDPTKDRTTPIVGIPKPETYYVLALEGENASLASNDTNSWNAATTHWGLHVASATHADYKSAEQVFAENEGVKGCDLVQGRSSEHVPIEVLELVKFNSKPHSTSGPSWNDRQMTRAGVSGLVGQVTGKISVVEESWDAVALKRYKSLSEYERVLEEEEEKATDEVVERSAKVFLIKLKLPPKGTKVNKMSWDYGNPYEKLGEDWFG